MALSRYHGLSDKMKQFIKAYISSETHPIAQSAVRLFLVALTVAASAFENDHAGTTIIFFCRRLRRRNSKRRLWSRQTHPFLHLSENLQARNRRYCEILSESGNGQLSPHTQQDCVVLRNLKTWWPAVVSWYKNLTKRKRALHLLVHLVHLQSRVHQRERGGFKKVGRYSQKNGHATKADKISAKVRTDSSEIYSK